MKNILILLLILVLPLTACTVSAFSISVIGDGTTANASRSLLVDLSIATSNTADLANNIFVTSNAGGNLLHSSGDQSGSVLDTGNASAEAYVINDANKITDATAVESESTSNDYIADIGNQSEVSLSTEENIVGTLDLRNTVSATNMVAVSAISGNNTVYSGGKLMNTSLTTGISDSLSTVTNDFNVTFHSLTRTIKP